MTEDFNFSQSPRPPVLLPTNPPTDSPSIPKAFSTMGPCNGCTTVPPNPHRARPTRRVAAVLRQRDPAQGHVAVGPPTSGGRRAQQRAELERGVVRGASIVGGCPLTCRLTRSWGIVASVAGVNSQRLVADGDASAAATNRSPIEVVTMPIGNVVGHSVRLVGPVTATVGPMINAA